METDPTSVYEIASFSLLLLHGISLPLQVVLQPIIDVILVNEAKVSQTIIGEI